MPTLTKELTDKTLLKDRRYIILTGNPPRDTKDYVLIDDDPIISRQPELFGVTPNLQIYSWNTQEFSPFGQRHIPSGHFAFKSNVSELGYIDMGKVSKIGGSGLGETQCITFKVQRQISQMGITKMRIWKSFNSGLGTYGQHFSVNFTIQNNWEKGKILGSGTVLSQTLPTNQNIFRNDSYKYINSGELNQYIIPDKDAETSQFVYLSMNTGNTFNNGFFGRGGAGVLRMRITYDYFIGPA